MDRVMVRPIRPSDETALKSFYAGMSAEARRARFLGCCSGVDDRCARLMCAANGQDEAGFVATISGSRSAAITGHVSLMQVKPTVFEIAIAVADEWQHRGLGQWLFAIASSWAAAHGAEELVATALTDNWRVLRLLGSSGHATVRNLGSGLSGVTIKIRDDALKPAA